MSNIGICHYKIGGTDGVSLEIDKWKRVLEGMGHEVHLCGGDLGQAEGFLIEELYHHREDVERIFRNAFNQLSDYESEADLEKEIFGLAEKIELGLRAFIEERSIHLLVPNNIWSLGASLPAAVAFARVIHDLGIPAVAHHHDFHWETFRGMLPTCEVVTRIARKYLPPKDPLITHVVINSLVQQELQGRDGIESTVIPNFFDFGGDPWKVDSYNQGFREAIGVKENDVVLLQATRVVERKGIELAIDLVKELNKPGYIERLQGSGLYDGRTFSEDSRIFLVLAGYSEDPNKKYLNQLKQKVERAGIEARFISDLVRSRRGEIDGQRLYSLWDCYVFADLVTYPSIYEGWGNQFLEAIRARLPIVIFEYPVYQADIKDRGFEVISLGDKVEGVDDLGLVMVSEIAVRKAVENVIDVLTKPSSRQAMVDRNFNLGRELYSLESLERYLDEVIERALA